MPQAGFEPTIPAFERAKTVHALERAATVTGGRLDYDWKLIKQESEFCSESLFSFSK
jgi:hypothetical protein